MTLYDEEGHAIARIHTNFEQQITKEELERRKARQGKVCTTAELLDDLGRLYASILPDEFVVEWLPYARADLARIANLTEMDLTPHTDRHRNALVKFARGAVVEIDRKLRAWATLAGESPANEHMLAEEQVLENVRGLDIVFKVTGQIVQVEHVRETP